MADELQNLDNKTLEQLEEVLKDIAKSQKRPINEVVLTKNSIKSIAKEILDGNYKFTQKTNKILSSDIGKLFQQALKEEQSSRKGFWSTISRSGGESIDWNLDRRINGLNSVLSGNFKYGALQIAQSFRMGRAFIGHPLVQFAAVVAKFTSAIMDFNSAANVFADKLAGGALTYSTGARENKYTKMYERKALAIMYGQKPEDYTNFIMGSFGAGTKERLNKDPLFGATYNQGRAILERFGADPNQMNELMKQQTIIGRSTVSMEKFNYKLIKAFEGLDKFSSQSFVQSLTEINKTLIANNIQGIASTEWLKKFQNQLNAGTLAAQDFIRGLTSRRGAETSTLAGVGAMLAERGLGGKELQEAYKRGDMIAVAGAVRRGGMSMQRDIEKIAPEIAQRLGTTDWKEALALQSGTPWGQLTGDLKKLDIQDILSKGGSLTVGLQGKELSLTNITKTKEGKEISELEDFKVADKELINATVENTGAMKTLSNAVSLLGSYILADYEQRKNTKPIIDTKQKNSQQIIVGNPNTIK